MPSRRRSRPCSPIRPPTTSRWWCRRRSADARGNVDESPAGDGARRIRVILFNMRENQARGGARSLETAGQAVERSRGWRGLLAVLGIGAALRLWGLEHNGFGTDYYSAGVRSMLDS